jgi:acyl carrier protein
VSENRELPALVRPTPDEVGTFIVNMLREMNYEVADADEETLLGPAGIDLESLAVVELSYRIEDVYHARFNEDDMEWLAVMTLGELTAEVIRRSSLDVR